PDSNRRRPAWEGAAGRCRDIPSYTFRSLGQRALRAVYRGCPTSPKVLAESMSEFWQNVAARVWAPELGPIGPPPQQGDQRYVLQRHLRGVVRQGVRAGCA